MLLFASSPQQTGDLLQESANNKHIKANKNVNLDFISFIIGYNGQEQMPACVFDRVNLIIKDAVCK